MRQANLQELFQAREYATIVRELRAKGINDLSQGQKQYLVMSEAANLNVREARLLYKQFAMQDEGLLAHIAYHAGDFDESLRLARLAEDAFLAADSLIATGRYDEVESELRNEIIGGRWYYYRGRAHGYMNQWAEALSCHDEAFSHYGNENNFIQQIVVLANAANLTAQSGDLLGAHKKFRRALRSFRKSDFLEFPQEQANCLLNFSYFQFQQGRYLSALRLVARACHILRKTQGSQNFDRANLLLAFYLISFGSCRRAEEILHQFQPKSKFNKFDYYRYRSYCAMELGDILRARAELARAYDFVDEEDAFTLTLLPMDRFELLYRDGRYSTAFESAKNAVEISRESGNLEQLFYSQTMVAYRSFDQDTARQHLSFHRHHKLDFELGVARLTIAMHEIRQKFWEAAEATLLEEVPFPLPLQEAERLIHLAIIASHLNADDSAMAMLDKANYILRRRDAIEIKLRILELRLRLARPQDSRRDAWIAERLSLRAAAGQGQLDWIDTWLGRMHFDFQERYYIQNGRLNCWIPSAKLKDVRKRARYTLDLRDRKLYWNDKVWDKIDRYPLLRDFMFYLAKRESTVSKAEIAKQVYKKKSYNPLTDDNLIYVGVNRLRRLLPENILIENINGEYRLRQAEDVLVIQDSCSPEDWNRFSVEAPTQNGPEDPNPPTQLH